MPRPDPVSLDAAYRGLGAAIVLQAFRDVHRKSQSPNSRNLVKEGYEEVPRNPDEAREWLLSQECQDILDFIGVNIELSDQVIDNVVGRNRQKLRKISEKRRPLQYGNELTSALAAGCS